MLKLFSESTGSVSICAAEHEGVDGEPCDFVVSGACTTLLHSGKRLHPKNVFVLSVICNCIVDAHLRYGGAE